MSEITQYQNIWLYKLNWPHLVSVTNIAHKNKQKYVCRICYVTKEGNELSFEDILKEYVKENPFISKAYSHSWIFSHEPEKHNQAHK